MLIPGHQRVWGHRVADCECEHLMSFTGDWVNKGKPRRYTKVETRNFSFEFFNISHSDGSEYKRTADPSNEVTEFRFLAHMRRGSMLTKIYKTPRGTREMVHLLAGYFCCCCFYCSNGQAMNPI